MAIDLGMKVSDVIFAGTEEEIADFKRRFDSAVKQMRKRGDTDTARLFDGARSAVETEREQEGNEEE